MTKPATASRSSMCTPVPSAFSTPPPPCIRAFPGARKVPTWLFFAPNPTIFATAPPRSRLPGAISAKPLNPLIAMTPPPMQNFPPASALFPFTSRNGLSKVASFSSASPSGKTKSASPQSPPLLLPTAQSLLTLRTPPMPLQKTRRLPKIKTRTKTSRRRSPSGTGATLKSCPNKSSAQKTTIKKQPPFGVAGWTKDDAAVLLYDKFDLWQVAPDGLRAVRLTDGAADQVRHRYEKLDPEEEWIDTSKPIYLSPFGIWSKKSGFARLRPGASGALAEEHLVLLDKSLDHLAKAKDADVFEYVEQTFAESPNAFIATADLKDAKAATKTNPFQSRYAWSREELIEYKNSHGGRLQGALFYPAGYDPARKYPMIVYMYEKLSDNLHRYSPPSERNYYNLSAMASHGYFVLEPDIVFKPRDPGVSAVDCVTAAAKRVIQMGVVDPKRIGIMGHSWGGFDTTYLATHTANFFASAVAGAPITDLVSNYGNHHWSSGIAETDHIETGQQRMEVPLYEDLQAYIRNSAVFGVAGMTTPLLIEVGDSDGTVFFHQGVELYNIARRARKDVVRIEYAGERHGLRNQDNQIDYQRRIFQWFGHYLKDEPTPLWISKGETYLDHERELKKLKAASAKN